MIIVIHLAHLAGASFARLPYRPSIARSVNFCFALILIASTILAILPLLG